MHIDVQLLQGNTVLDLQLQAGKGNVLTTEVLHELVAHLRAHRDRPHLRMVLLRGSGGHFSFGAAVDEHRKDKAAAMLREFHSALRAVATCEVPVVALVEGKCLGGAFELALVCHVVLAAPNASFACPEIKLGVLPPVLAAVGASRLGAAWTERLVLTGAELPLAVAESTGFAVRLPADIPALDAALGWYDNNLAGSSAHSLRVAVRAVRDGTGLTAALGEPLDRAERLYLDRLLPSHDGNEGIEAFLGRRPPQWRDA